jgi:hypothetical protein
VIMSTELLTSGASCSIFQIPPVCSGAALNGAPPSGDLEPANYKATYPIGALAATLRGYDPSNNAFQLYNFLPSDVMARWTPGVYQISGGVVMSYTPGQVLTPGATVSAGLQCASNYNTDTEEYTLVSWYRTAIAGSINTPVI